MTRHLEDELREMFGETAARAPQLPDPATVTVRAREAAVTTARPWDRGRDRRGFDAGGRGRLPRHRRRLLGVAGVGLVAAGIAAAVAVAPGVITSVSDQGAPEGGGPTQAAPPHSASPGDGAAPASPSGALPTLESLRCTAAYSPDTLAQTTSFAFDGTVTSIGPTQDPADAGTFAEVSFKISEWFAGAGTGAADATVTMVAPDIDAFESSPPAYRPGTRLLISGQPRDAAAPTQSLVAEACPGFTRHYDAATAKAWSNAYR